MRITEKGQVTIPKQIRDRLGVGPGSEVEFVEQGDMIVLEKRTGAPAATYASFDEWAADIAGTIENHGMDGKDFVDWLRGRRDDVDAH